jgi:4-hydroxybenzoate polyprenyltransferase
VSTVLSKLKDYLAMIDFSHTLFGLPFAYLGAFLAHNGTVTLHQLIWITVAMVSARTAALSLNRIIDLPYDAANPRTAGWTLPSGRLNPRWVWIGVFFFLALLLFAASQLNPLCLKLSPLAVVILWGYSYTKRYTWLCHLFLGMAIGMGPIGAWFAVTGTFDWQPFLLGAAVAFWIAGFDTMYACQDIEFDRQTGLYSIPARFGERNALIFSTVFHILTVIFLILTGVVLQLGGWFYGGVVLAAVVLVYEHRIVQPGDLSRVKQASFQLNHYVGLLVLIAALIDIYT